MAEKRTVEIDVKITGLDQTAKLTNLADKFDGIANSVKSLSEALGGLKSTLESIKVPQEFSKAIDGLKDLSKVGKMPDLDNVAKGFQKLGKIDNIPNLSGFINELKKFKDIKVPNINQVATGIKKLSDNTLSVGEGAAKLNKLYYSLNQFSKVQLPNFDKFISGFEKLKALDVGGIAAKLKDMNTSISNLDKAGHLRNFANFAKDLNQVSSALTKATEGLARAKKAVKDAGDGFENAGKKVKTFGDRLRNYVQYRVIADTIMKMRDAFYNGIDAIVEYDQALKDLQAITGATNLEVAQMGEKIKEVASSTKFSASEVAAGMRTIGQAGFSAAESIGTMQAVSDLATGTLSDMSTSVDLVTTAMRVFSIDASESSRVSDVFANAVNRSKLTIDKLRTAMNYVGPIAKNAGVTFEEMSASMMTLANSGIQASKIGTGLRRVFAELLDPSKKLEQAARRAGIALQDLDPRTATLSDVFKNLGVVVNDAEIAFDLFGKRGASAVLALTNNQSQFDTLLDSVGRSGTAAAMAATQIEGLGVSFKNLKDKLGLLAIAIGDLGITDVMRVLIDVGKGVVDAITAVVDTAFAKFIAKGAILVVSVLAITKAFKALLALNIGANLGMIAGKMIAFTTATVSAEAAVGTLALVLNPLFALLAAGAATLVYLFSTMDSAKEAAEDAAKLADNYSSLGKSFQDYKVNTANMKEGSDELKQANLQLRDSLLETASGMTDISDDAAEAASSINPLTGEILDQGEALKRYNEELGKLTLQKLVDSADAAGDNIDKQASGVSRFVNRWKDAFSQVGTLGAGLGNTIVAGFDAEFSEIPKIVKKTFADTTQYGEAVKESMDFSKELDKGNVSFKQLSNYVNSLNLSNLTNQQEDIAEAYKLLNERSEALLKNLVQTGQIDLNDTIENIQTFAEGAGLAGIELEALIAKIKVLQGAEDSNYSNILEKWASDAENVTSNVTALIPEFKALGGEITAAQEAQIAQSEKIKQSLAEEYRLAKEKLDAEIQGGKDKEKAYREFYAEEKRLLAESQKVISDTAQNSAAQTIIALQKAKDELVRSQNEINVKYKDNIQLLVKYLIEAETKYETTRGKLLGKIVDPKALLAESKSSVKEIQETYAGMYKDLELEILNKQKTEEEAAAIKRKLEKEEAKEIVDIWNKANEEIIAQNDPESPASRSIANARRDAAIEQGKVEVETAKEAAKEKLEAQKDLFAKEKEIRETNFAEYITAIDQQEQQGVLSHEEAETAKMNASLERYAEEYRIAKEYHDKIDEGQNPEEYQRSLKVMLDMEEQFYESKGKYIEQYNKKVDKLNDNLEDKQRDRLQAEKKNAKKLEDIQEDLADDLEDIEKDYIEDVLDMKHDYAEDVEDIEHDLAEKIKDIKKDLAEKIKDIDEDIVDNKKKLKADLLGIEKDTDDIEKEIRQRGMSDRQKDADNEKSIYKELSEIREGIAKAESEGNAEVLQHYQDRLKGLQDESGELKSKSDALNALHAVEKEMMNARNAEGRVEQIKLENEMLEEQRKAQEKIKEEEDDAAYEKDKLQEKFDYEMDLLDKAKARKIEAEEESAQKAIDNENYRHQLVMENLDLEISKIQEKLEAASNNAAVASGSEISDTPTSKSSADNPIAEKAQQAKVAIQEMDSQMAATATNMIQQSKEIADNGFRVVEENGKKVYTNLTDAQRNAFKVMAEAMLTDSQGTMDAISESTKEGAAQIEEAVATMKEKATEEIPINVEQEPEIPDIQEQLPEEVEVPLSVTVDTVNQDIEDVKTNLNTIAETEVKADVQIVSEDKPVSETVEAKKVEIQALSETEVEVPITFNTEVIEEIKAQIEALNDIGVEVQVTVKGSDLVQELHELLSEIVALNPVKVPVTTTVDGKEEVMALKLLMEEIIDLAKKTIKIVAEVTGIEKVYELRDAIAQLKDKVVTVTTRYVEERAGGGYIGKYADGGNVFNRLANRYISSGSGHKDDVPALLMKGEFVHRTAAVRKYGKRFMEMVNSGLYPVELAKRAIQKYATGGAVGVNIIPDVDTSGFVQQFATGGMVLSGMVGSLKKKLFEMLGKTLGTDVNLNIDNVNLKSDIQQRADNITSSVGQEAIASMAGTFNDAVSQFADGGSITNTTLMFDRERQKIENDYDKKISAAKKSGNDEIAALLVTEREDLKIIADTLKEELTTAKTAYDDAVAARKAENEESIAEMTSDYDRDVLDENEDYRRKVEDDTLDYNREKADYDLETAREKEELEEDIAKIKSTINDNERKILDDLISAKDDIDEKLKDLDNFGRYLTEVMNINGNRVYTGENTFHYKEHFTPKKWNGIGNSPSLEDFEEMINMAFRHGTGKLGTAGKEEATEKLNTLWNEYASSNLGLRKEYAIPEVRVLLDESESKILQTLEGLGIQLPKDDGESTVFQRLAVALNRDPTQTDIDERYEDYNEKKYDRDLDWARYQEDYGIDTSRRDTDHATELNDLKTAFENAVNEENLSLAEDLASYKEDYDGSILSLKEQAEADVATRKEQTEGEVNEAKTNLKKTLADLDSSLKEELMAKDTAQSLAVDPEDVATPKADEKIRSHAAMSIEELLRRLRFPKFNIGGFVNHTTESIPGKDSIMAALTPGEFVIREPAVKMFGQGFFDALNNFQIPKFNLGGVVGPLQKSVSESIQQSQERYALDLTINGNSYDSLYGTQKGINDILNDLNLAKLRS